MKKILIILAALVLLTSCNYNNQQKELKNKQVNTNIEKSETNTKESFNDFDEKTMENVVGPLLEVK